MARDGNNTMNISGVGGDVSLSVGSACNSQKTNQPPKIHLDFNCIFFVSNSSTLQKKSGVNDVLGDPKSTRVSSSHTTLVVMTERERGGRGLGGV